MKNKGLHFHKVVGIAFISAMFLLAAGPAMAGDIDVTAAESISTEQTVLGLGLAVVPDYEGSDDYTAAPLLQARVNWSNNMYFSLLGNTARFNLIPSQSWTFGPLLRYRAERDDVENDRVDRLEDVDAAVELGAFFSYNLPSWIFTITAAQDVADAHDGYVVDLGAGYRLPLQKQTMLTFFALTTYASEDYMDTYFGVDPADSARSGLNTFDADSEWKDVGAGILVNHRFKSNWGMIGAVKYTKLLGDASDSPIVDDEGEDNQWLYGVIVNYRF
ncbi:MipA/OmpV family protein [Desulfuromonas sp. TF]|uniref:MipA/OmpV family protein n=1 Tax=Desulfuromonas sp. TF TaxID=1232410 RepID=UPI00042A606D|nr:MipA/OmpV family protein [Desulfuromonas sp. TF]